MAEMKLLQTDSSQRNPSTFVHAVRTAVAAIASYLFARLFHLPEAYWAPVSTMIVIQSTLGASLSISLQRFGGTAIGAIVAAITGAWFPGNVWAFGVAVFLIGFLCAALQIERAAYRFGSITLVIVMLVPRTTSVAIIAIHRFCEVSLGIAVGLLLAALWQERRPAPQ